MIAAELRFTVFGRPQAKGSKRALPAGGRTGGRIILRDSNPNAAAWANRVADRAQQAILADPEWVDVEILRNPVTVELLFYFARPQGHYGTGRNRDKLRPSAPPEMAIMPDIDKLARCTLDAMTGVVFHDDGQVAELYLRKRYGTPERVEIRVADL
jgi:Holliday junction resolvase RusA-like endonuclease